MQAKASLVKHIGPRQLQRRKLHTVPDLHYHKTFSEEGIPGLMSNVGYRIAWTDYEGMVVNKLNELTAGEKAYTMRVKDIVVEYARDPLNASLFNHASMAFNNHFFFKGLSSAPLPIHAHDVATLKRSLERTFGSIDTLRTTMLDTAAAMFGPGFVWLVWIRGDAVGGSRTLRPNWRILTTYNAGTPYPEAGYRHQGIDMNTSNAATFAAYQNAEPVNTAGAFGRNSETGKLEAKIPVGGTSLTPVLCVNTWEHVWIYDYGILGKRKFLADWWDAVDWGVVNAEAPRPAKEGNYL